MLPILLQLPPLLLPDYSIYSIEAKFELNQRRFMYANCQNSVSQELVWVLSWNFQRMLKGEHHLTIRQFVHNTANTAVTFASTATTSMTTFTATTCKAKSTDTNISRSI